MPAKTPVRLPRRRSGFETCVLQRPPARLQQQPLLRIEERGLDRRDPEEPGIELVDSFEKPAPSGGGAVGIRRIRPVPGPASFRHGDDGVASVAQQILEGAQILAARKAAGHADDGDRLALAGERAIPGIELDQQAPGEIDVPVQLAHRRSPSRASISARSASPDRRPMRARSRAAASAFSSVSVGAATARPRSCRRCRAKLIASG